MCAHVCQICLQPTDLNRKLTRMAQMEEVNSHACTNNPLEHHFLQIRVPLRCKFEFHLHKFGCSCGLHWREQLDLHFPEVLVPVPLVNQGESKRSCIVNIKCCLGFGTCIAVHSQPVFSIQTPTCGSQVSVWGLTMIHTQMLKASNFKPHSTQRHIISFQDIHCTYRYTNFYKCVFSEMFTSGIWWGPLDHLTKINWKMWVPFNQYPTTSSLAIHSRWHGGFHS